MLVIIQSPPRITIPAHLLPAGPSRAELAALAILQRPNLYRGTVPADVIACRRAKNKVARRSRRVNRMRAA